MGGGGQPLPFDTWNFSHYAKSQPNVYETPQLLLLFVIIIRMYLSKIVNRCMPILYLIFIL